LFLARGGVLGQAFQKLSSTWQFCRQDPALQYWKPILISIEKVLSISTQ